MTADQDAIFLVDGEQLVELQSTPYELEDDFQAQLANHPELLGGGKFPGTEPRRWLLVDREVSIPDRTEGSGRWSLDHLFVDQDAVPTLVEVKRASDSRIRREMVGQMLDYAANGARHWPGEVLRERWERSLPEDEDPDRVAQSFAGMDADEFWGEVIENLHNGRVRMLFVSEAIPLEVQTVIEYLNEQMSSAEVLGVSISRYTGRGLSVLVPRVVGSSARIEQAKRARSGKTYAEYIEEGGDVAREVEQRVLQFAEEHGYPTRPTPKSLQVRTLSAERDFLVFFPGFGTLQLSLAPLRHRGMSEMADEILARARRIAGEGLTEKYPAIPLDLVLEYWDEVEGIMSQLGEAYGEEGASPDSDLM